MATMAQMATVVARAHPATTEDREILVEASEILSGQKLLKVGKVVEMLGVSSPSTIRNWLEEGYFGDDVIRTENGTRLFRLADVLAAKARMEQTLAENAAGTVEFTDYGDRGPRRYRRRSR